ncbi:hypothetical protein [Marinomonas sp. THO17]|uniref:hypothetical protein n=1 Tax=Marinomonas sp. THO17 TaxID=3149048 RepID=UPI00336BC491
MKQAKRRLVRIRYGFRFIRRPNTLKKRVKKAQPTKSTQTCLQPNTSPSQNIETPEPTTNKETANTTTPLAHFDLSCNPYQQFINNLCMQLPDLPQDAFTRSPIDTRVQSHIDSASSSLKQPSADCPSSDADEQTDDQQEQDKAEDGNNAEDDDNDDESATQSISEEIHSLSDEEWLPKDPSTIPSPLISESSQVMSPSLQNLSNIPSCMLASKH